VLANLSAVCVTITLYCLFTTARVLLLGNPWLIAMAKAKKAAAAEAPAAGTSDSDAGACFQWRFNFHLQHFEKYSFFL